MRHSFHEPFVLFGYLAGLTDSLEFVTGILILPQRQTALVAKQAVQVDLLSGGRLRLGVGVGWNPVEYEALGEDFTKRGQRLTEQVELLKALWTEPLVNFEGEFDHIPDAGLNPLPVQRPIPIWFGGIAEPALRRMARLGEGWIAVQMSLERTRPVVEKIRRYVSEAGRNPADFGFDFRLSPAKNPPSTWASELESWRNFGADYVALNTMGAGLDTPQAHLDFLRRYKETVEG
jgi:probable F420-dependent oxidoreductase